MTFIVTLIALLIERFFDWSHLRYWEWYTKYQRMMAARFTNLRSYLLLAAVIAPLVFGTVLIQLILSNFLYGVIELVFQVVVLLYCLGPQNLWADVFACINSFTQENKKEALEKLKSMFGLSDVKDAQKMHQDFLGGIFSQANTRVFAVVFWFVVFGPAGAVLYRAISLSSANNSSQEVLPEIAQNAQTTEEALNWLPARVFTFLFALAGHFSNVITCWRKSAGTGLSGNETFIAGCGIAAMGREDQDKFSNDGSVERSAVNLLDRVFCIMLVLVLIVALLS